MAGKIILASASPRRSELLEQIGVCFTVKPSDADENIEEEMSPGDFVKELAVRKAADIQLQNSPEHIIIGADTIVVYKDEIMGKPKDVREAESMLKRLQGNIHKVYTGVAVLTQGGKLVFAEETEVEMYPMTESEIKAYVATGEPMDKAGAYGIQGKSAAYIKGIQGDYNNVVGLPVGRLYQETKRAGIEIRKAGD